MGKNSLAETIWAWIKAIFKYFATIFLFSIVAHVAQFCIMFLMNVLSISYGLRMTIAAGINTIITFFLLWKFAKAEGANAAAKQNFNKVIVIGGNVLALTIFGIMALFFPQFLELYVIAVLPMILLANYTSINDPVFLGVIISIPFLAAVKILGEFYGSSIMRRMRPSLQKTEEKLKNQESEKKEHSWKDSIR